MRTRNHLSHRLVVFALLAATLTAGVAASPALASLIQCRSDPLVLLSDGTLLDISADIGTLLFNVTEVNYVLHIPAGLQVVLALSTPAWPTTIEHFTVYADNPAGKYDSTTVVHTTKSQVSVTAHMLVDLMLDSTSGLNGQALSISLIDPLTLLNP